MIMSIKKDICITHKLFVFLQISIEDEDIFKIEGEECGVAGPSVSGLSFVSDKTKNCGQCEEGLTCQLTFILISKCGKCTRGQSSQVMMMNPFDTERKN